MIEQKYTYNVAYNKIAIYIIYTHTIFAGLVFLSTELLSIKHNLTRTNIISFWTAILFLLICYILRYKLTQKYNFHIIKIHNLSYWKNKTLFSQCCISIFLITVTFFLALSIVPNNWDSMTYHCSRIMNWVQNKSVTYYPTNNIRQTAMSPFAEYFNLLAYFLFNNDKTFNLLQWYSYTLNSIFIFLICKKLNLENKLCLLGTIIVLTTPIMIAESVTTQTDLFASVWVLFFFYLLIDFEQYKKLTLSKEIFFKIITCGSILGIAYISKPQNCTIMAILFIWLFIARLIKKDKLHILISFILIAALFVLPFTIPSFVRNFYFAGNITAVNVMPTVLIGTLDPKYIIVNIFKNWAQSSYVHGNTALNLVIIKLVHAIAAFFNIDINTKVISFSPDFDAAYTTSYHHDVASAPFICIGLIFAAIFKIFSTILKIKNKEKLTNKDALVYFILFSIIFSFAQLRWQPWCTRLFIPSYYTATICIVLILNDFFSLAKYKDSISFFITSASAILVYCSLTPIATQGEYFLHNRKQETRLEGYFENRKEFSEYSSIIDYIQQKKYEKIGIYLDEDAYEYPLWIGLKNRNTTLIQVVPNNKKASISPECIIAIHRKNFDLGDKFNYLGNIYTCTFLANNKTDFAILEMK